MMSATVDASHPARAYSTSLQLLHTRFLQSEQAKFFTDPHLRQFVFQTLYP